MASDNGGVNNSTRFIYQLEGFNDKWIKTTAANPDITYMSLPPGSYTLCVRMLKDDGTMGEVESRLEITIGSPWYSSWWAWCCYGLLVALLLFAWSRMTQWRKAWREYREQRRMENSVSEPVEDKPEDDGVEEAVLMDDEEA